MTRRTALESPRLRKLWRGRFWILTAVLGGTTLYTAATMMHDGTQRRLAAGLITQATALHISALASARLERLALEAFAPVGPMAALRPEASTGPATIRALAGRQREGERCACRELLPITHFFHVDPGSGAIDMVPADDARERGAPPPAVLTELARAELREPRGVSSASAHLVADPRLGDQSIVTLVQRDDRGSALAVYGIVARTRPTLATLFDRGSERSAIDSAGLTRLDSLSLEVRSTDGTRLYGALGAGRSHAIVQLGGPLRGLALTVAIAPGRIASPLMAPHSRASLWNLGALLAATVLVLGIAVGSSRRELLLARARADFIAGVSHDLRMPLAQILIASETLVLRRERNDGDRVSLASSIVRETQRLIALVDNVLLFSRSGAVALEPALRAVPIDELLDETIEAVRLAVDDAGQTLEVSPAPSLAVLADRRLVRQALVNLVDNALKYGAPGQRVRLGAERFGTSVRLSVEDEGPGIPPAERDRIFEPYARLAHDQLSERTGTGLGLAVVRQIAEACGGRVWLDDRRPHGARVVLELRAAIVPASAEAAVVA